MNVFRKSVAPFFTALWLMCVPVGAADTMQLSEQSISRFVETWPEICSKMLAVDSEFDPENHAGLGVQLTALSTPDGEGSARDGVVRAFAYADVESWAATGARIVMAAQWAKNPPDERDLAEAEAAINKDENRSDAEKATLIADLKSALVAAQKAKPDDADIDAAKALLPLIEEVIWKTD